MNRNAVITGLAIAGLFLVSRNAKAAVRSNVTLPPMPVTYPEGYFDMPAPTVEPAPIVEPEVFVPLTEAQIANRDWEDYYGGGVVSMLNAGTGNIAAFLKMLRFSEHDYSKVVTGADYNTFVGNTAFTNFADHPVLTGEKKAIRNSAATCKRVGYPSGVCFTTAAGAYQFIVPTWQNLRAIEPRLPDFSPASQDEAARRLLDQIGAENMIRDGNFKGALAVASKVWDSLPGSGNANARTLDYVTAQYREAGGKA